MNKKNQIALDWWNNLPGQNLKDPSISKASYCMKYYPEETSCYHLNEKMIISIWEKEVQKTKNIFIICSVRGATKEYQDKLELYVAKLEADGCEVHLPHRDTNQNATGIEICTENAIAIELADEVHIFYNSKSQGTHFDMGVAFAFQKKIVVIDNEVYGEGKSYPRMLVEWQAQ